MNQKRFDEIHRINYLTSETQALYHQASLKLGITDSVSIVLYTIYDTGENCLLSDIYKKSGISKQTVNSAIRSLEADGILYLEQYTGRAKKTVLTEKGEKYVNQTVAKLYQAEVQALESWSAEEINTYIRLMEKYADCFRKQTGTLHGKKL
jgi:DNA-binding MarR family transcriptional regulator